MIYFREVMSFVGTALDGFGVFVVLVGVIIATVRFVAVHTSTEAYRRFRQDLGRAILLGLEFLIAGDIIRTVVVDPTVVNVIALGLIVVIRTFLSVALQLEVEGRWPWQRTVNPTVDPGPARSPSPSR